MAKKLPPVHPGEILREEFLVPLKLTPYAVAAALHVPRTRIERIAREEKPVTADTALRLGNTRTLVSFNLEKPTATVDHFAIGIPRYDKDAAVRYLTERGVKPLEGNFAGFHVLDPDGIRVQISAQS